MDMYITLPSHRLPASSTGALPFLRRLDGRKAGWWLAAAVQAGVVLYVGSKIFQEARTAAATQANRRRLQQRCFQLATQGSEAAGTVPADLGQPDEHDVYCYTSSSSGRQLFFRQGWRASGKLQWEMSTDRQLWIPTCHADSLWYAADSHPSSADKVLIQQLHIEASLIAQQGRSSSSGAGLPPLDLSNALRDISQASQVPEAFLCPISMAVMTQPVVTPSGASFDRPAILWWIRQHHTDPVSGQPLRSDELYPNLVMRDMIHAWAHATPQQQQQQVDAEEQQRLDVGPQQRKATRDQQQRSSDQQGKDGPRLQHNQMLVAI